MRCPPALPEPPRLVGDGWHFGSTGRVMLVMIEVDGDRPGGARQSRNGAVG